LPLDAVRTQQLDHEQLGFARRARIAVSPVGAVALDDSLNPEPEV
jgi:hypothetical protein